MSCRCGALAATSCLQALGATGAVQRFICRVRAGCCGLLKWVLQASIFTPFKKSMHSLRPSHGLKRIKENPWPLKLEPPAMEFRTTAASTFFTGLGYRKFCRKTAYVECFEAISCSCSCNQTLILSPTNIALHRGSLQEEIDLPGTLPQVLLWMNEILHHLETMTNH